MKAGAAFVLLDPSYPVNRLQAICEDVGARLIITSPAQSDLASLLSETVVRVSDSQEYWSHTTASNWSNPASQPTNALYVVFTSGSTGKPKGVLIEHAAFATRATAAGPGLGLDQKPRVLQFSSYAFHVSYRDILTTLCWGGCLCVPCEEDRRNDLSSFITRREISWACLTPSVITLLDPTKLPSLEVLVVAGESMPPATLDSWAGRVQLMNAYGPCECVGINALQSNLTVGMDCQNIGHGLAAVLWLVDVDNHDKLAPIGAVGEIVIEGPVMGRGYINHPEKTKESFLPSAAWQTRFRETGNSRLYMTGDLGRYDATDGTIVFVGRKDTQTKLNGQLIEMRDVEHHLQKSLAVSEAQVVPDLAVDVITPKGSTVPRLVACIETQGEKRNANNCLNTPEAVPESWHNLESQLATNLPKFMIPSSFIPVHQMPMTLSGKKDRKALKAVLESLSLGELQAYSSSSLVYEAPLNDQEKKLQSLWATALKQDSSSIGRQSHLFQLGGDSITAMKLVSLSREVGMKLTVDDIFQHPVLSAQAQACSSVTETNGDASVSAPYVPFSLINQNSSQQILASCARQCNLKPDQIEDVYPCTALQEGLMALTLRTQTAYTAQHVYRLHQSLDEEKYQAAWMATMEANPILRTRIVQTREGSFQVVAKSPPLIWNRRSNLDQCLEEDKREPMQLGGALIRLGIASDDSGQRYCVVTIYHALYDGWSKPLIPSQVQRAYHGDHLDRRPFAPFIKHVIHARHGSESFWATRLAGCEAPSFPSLPSADYIPSPKSSTEELQISCGTNPIETFTLNSRLRLAWALTLSHYLGSDDVVFGATVSGRGASVPGMDQMSGPAITTIPVRVQLSSNRTVKDTLQEIQTDFFRAIPNEQLGLARISKLNDAAHSACQFQNLLVVQPKQERQAKGNDFMRPVEYAESKDLAAFGTYAMTVHCQVQDKSNSVTLQLFFDEGIVGLPQAQRTINHFAHVLSLVNSNLDAPLVALASVSPQDMAELMAWNNPLPKSVNRCVQNLIAEQVSSQPEAEAVCAWDGSFSYQRLQQHSTTLARSLISAGVYRGDIIPIHMTKSQWLPVAILGVVMTGASFTLLDPSYPPQRIKTILNEIVVKVILSNVPEHEHLPWGTNARVLSMPDIFLGLCSKDQRPLNVVSDPRDCLYVAWTSGSTGKPKGVMINHNSLASTVGAWEETFNLTSTSRVLQFSANAFDASIFEGFATLMVGGCVCMPSEASRQSDIATVIQDMQVNWAELTPTVARLLRPADIQGVRMLTLLGEPVTQEDISIWRDHTNLFIGYGPTECTICSTSHSNPRPTDDSSIGSGVGSVCWVVNPADHNILLPIGAVGELLIEGPNVGMGYLNDLEKTKASFPDIPQWLRQFRNGEKTRLYKTGDLVQYSSNNKLRFIGRKDNQVKLHGQRLELGDIERHVWQALRDGGSKFDNMGEAVVAELVHPIARNGRPTLVAFISVNAHSHALKTCDEAPGSLLLPSTRFTETCNNVQAVMLARVPKHMVPAVFFPLVALPQTLTGKVDRKGLRELCVSLSASTWDVYTRRHNKDSRPPSNNAEQMLYNLVKDVLDIEDFGMDSHFFHLGGDSLVAMQVVSLAHEAGIQLYVHDFFKFPILAALAKTLKAHQEDMQEIRPFQLLANADLQEEALELAQRTFQVSRDDIEDIYPCTPLQEGMFAETLKKRSRAQNPYVSKSVFKFREDIDLKGFRIAWEKVAKINPILRTRILSGLSKTLQVVMANPSLPWEEHEGTLEDFRRGMSNHDPIPDFQKPLLQFSVVRDVQNHQKYFVSTIHHALYDGWSWPLIIDQLEAAYNSTTPTISPRPYVSFVKYIQSLDEHKVVNFWKSQLDGISAPQFPVLPSPTFKPNPNKSLTRRSLRIHDPSVMGVTSASVIQLSWALTVTQYTGSNDCVFGLVASGRDAPFNGIERVVGPTMATFPLCTRLEKSKMVQELLSDMQTQGILAASYGHMGLQNISRLGADAAAGCQFQNLLVIQPSSTDDSNPFFGQKVKFPADATPAFDAHALTVVCNLKDSGQLVDVQASYDETVISTCQMGWVLDQFGHFIEWVSQEPQGRVDDIAAVSPNHLQQLRIWNQSPAHPVRSCIHDLVFQRQGLDPTALAVNSWDGDLTYRELDVLSSCLAKRLTEDNGIGPGTFVPLFFEKSKWVVVAMLAVSKAGGAFLLLDSSQPVQRQHSLCQEVDAEVVLASLGHVDRISNPGWHVLPIGDGSINGEDGANDDSTSFSHPAVCSDDPVYICFTSGSTGKPKGAVIEHAMIATTAVIQGKIQGLNPQTRVLQFTSFTFDTCLAEILYTLVHGGCICLPEEAGGRAVVPAIHKYNVNWVALTPSVARTVDPEDIPSVKTLVLGGEAMQANDVATWGDRLFLANGYGPTECAVETHINAPVGIGSKSSNIGRGVTAVSWVVDPDNVERLMPLGAPGELLIEGPTVGRGYLNEPEKTDAAFIKSPSWLQDMRMGQGRRIYRTGDLVRFSPESDASLEILGRKDSQVKIRGQRIELGEVEFQVRRLFPGAKAVVAETIQPAHAGPQLLLTAFIHTGYADGEASTQGTDNEIFLPPQIGDFAAQVVKAEALLQEHLPKAMIPELFVPLAYLPLSSADKTDRLLLRKKASALSVEEIRAYKLEDGQVKRQPPAAPTEAMLHELVAHTLGLDTEAFGMNDHFLRLGGDSILAMRLVSSDYKRGMVLKVADIFAHPRLSDLANIMISVNEQAQEIPPFVLIQPDEREFIVKQAVIACAVPSSQIEDIYPCTPLQEGLLALTMQHAGAYTSRLSLSLSKNISRPIFQIAWAAVLDANPILRTRIIHVPQYGSFQVVVKSGMEWRTVTDLDTLTVEMGNPLMQFGFTSDDQFVFTLHHALYDGLSLQHIFRQLQAACVGQRLSRQPFVPFVKYLSGIDPKQASEFWRTQLADLKAPMFPEPPSGSHTAKPIKSLTSRTTFKMRDDFGVTLSALMKLAWGLTISRYTSANDVLYGAVVSGRSASIPGVEGMSGPTIATIPVRIRFSLEQTGRQMIEEVHQQGIQSIPFEQTGLQSIKKLGNGYSGAMQFQNLLVIQDSREGKASGDSLFTVNQNTDADKPFGTYGLILLCYPESQHIDLEAIFDDTMISSWQVDRILHYFQHILVQLNTACDLPLYDMMKGISLEDTVQLKKWNRSVPPSVQGFVHDLIIEKATVNPDATAICAWDGMLTYGELDRLSLQLSHVLVLKGVGPESVVPVYYKKSRLVPVMVLAIMRAGGAFLLLDINHPLDRLRGICDQVQPILAMSATEDAQKISSFAPQVLSISMNMLHTLEQSAPLPNVRASPSNTMYMVFTSGSTGKPKGVMVEYQSFRSQALSFADRPGTGPDLRHLSFLAYNFDPSVYDILMPLVVGGCLCIPSEEDRMNDLAGAINRLQANSTTLTPTVLGALEPDHCPNLRIIDCGGESLSQDIVNKWAHHVKLLAKYGPAECTVYCTGRTQEPRSEDPCNIGTAIGSVVWIVDPLNHEWLAPIGSVGELVVEGPLVAKGYVNNPEETNAAFIRPPRWLREYRECEIPTESRLYKTGDLVHYCHDGSIRFVGRRGTQVKINGQRMELGEIEHRVSEAFSGEASVVAEVATPSAVHGRKILAAFVCHTAEVKTMDTNAEDLSRSLLAKYDESFAKRVTTVKEAIAKTLPRPMVPEVFLPIHFMPCTNSAKVDRKLLRKFAGSLSREELGLSSALRMATTESERILQRIVAEALSFPVDEVHMDDDFFQAGGDSLAAMSLVAIARREQLELKVADIFNHPVLSDLAFAIEFGPGATTSEKLRVPAPFSLVKEDYRHLVMQQCHIGEDLIEDIYPCTPLQEGLMVLTMGKPGSYIAHHRFVLPKSIDLTLLRAAWKATFEANPILRTRIMQTGHSSLQVVLRDEFFWTDANGSTEDLKQQPMGIGSPLTQFMVIPQPTGELHLIFSIHHALYDGWSLPLVFRQVEQAYRQEKLQSCPFSPFVQYLALQEPQSIQQSWRSLFKDFDGTSFPVLPSSNYIPRPDEFLRHNIPTTSFAATRATAIKFAWATVLSQYTNSSDVVFGVTTSGRDAPVNNIDNMTGPTMTTYPFRASLSRTKTLRESMQDIQQQTIDMIESQHFGLQNISRLGPEAAAACKFQNLLVIQPKSGVGLLGGTAPGSAVGDKDGETFRTYALNVECQLLDGSIQVQMNFDSSLLPVDLAQRILFQFAHVLNLLQTEDSDCPLESLDSLNPQDFSILSQWAADMPRRVDDLVHDQIHAMCMKQKEKPAVCAWDGEFTYLELDQLSSQLAWHLQSIGAGPEVFVPICLEKCRWVIVAMLATIKAGSAFVLLDPSHPFERLKGACEDVQAEILITSKGQELQLGIQQLATTVIDITDPKSIWWQASDVPMVPRSDVRSTNALYCAFTSGSSGRPKGVVVEHVAFCTFCIGAGAYMESAHLTQESRVLQFASYAFDPCISDILVTLLVGGCICVPSEWERREDLGNAATRMQANWANLTPSVLRTLAPQDFPTLKTVVLGGESPSIREVNAWGGHTSLMNRYGPAEGCLCFNIQQSLTPSSDLSNIGYPMAGDCWVVNPTDHNKPVPIGAVGELVLGGARIGRGYTNNPVANAGAFIATPPSWWYYFRGNSKDTRLYKTGDLVQYASDGSLRYLGRKDFQVKIRGQRVEIGDIENTIQQSFPWAEGVAVDLVQNGEESFSKILTAFIQVNHHGCDESSPCRPCEGGFWTLPCDGLQKELFELEKRLQDRLPNYMVPARLLTSPCLPTNTSGKTDRRKLRDLASQLSLEELAKFTSGNSIRRQPTTLVEEVIFEVCAKILNVPAESIGMDDSFFHLGGDSILAVQFVYEARKRRVAFRVIDVFQHPRLTELAALTSVKQDLPESIDAEPAQALLPASISAEHALKNFGASSQQNLTLDNIQAILPATVGQVMRLHEPCHHFIHEISGSVDPDQLEIACQGLVQRHEILRTIFQQHNSTWVQVVLKQLELQLVRHEAQCKSLSVVKELCAADDIRIPPVNCSPVVQFSYIRGPDQISYLIIRLSHALYDGSSWRILYRDLEHLYGNLPLGDPVSYSKYIQQWAKVQADSEALDFWRDHLDGFQMSHIGDTTNSHAVKPMQPHTVAVGKTIPGFEPPVNITQATVGKAAWALTLARFSDTPNDITFGLTTSGRNFDPLATSEIFGHCINQVPVRVRLDSDSTVLGLMQSIQHQYAESMEFELVEFRNMVPGDTDPEPVFGSVLTFQNTRGRVSPLQLGTATGSWIRPTSTPNVNRRSVGVELVPIENELEVFVAAPNTIWTPERANEVHRVLCDLIPLLAKNAHLSLRDVGF